MKKIVKMIKAGDVIIVTTLVLLSFLPLAIFSYQENAAATENNTADNQSHVVISADGETVYEMELKNDHIREVYEYEDERGNRNVVVREGEAVYISEANCTDYLCVQQGKITEVGETIVCLPHKLLVEITSNNTGIDNEIDVISQ